MIICLYVDDLIFTNNDEHMFKEFKNFTMHEFDMSNLGKIRYFFGIKVLQTLVSQPGLRRDGEPKNKWV